MHRSTNPSFRPGSGPGGDEALASFEAGVLPDPFDHRAHVVACWRFLRAYGTIETLERLPAALRRAVAALGVPERYHHTLTWAWILEVAERLDGSPDPDAFLARHPELLTDLVRPRWGAGLHTAEARGRFVLPGRSTGAVRRLPGPFDAPPPGVQALHDEAFGGIAVYLTALQDRLGTTGAQLWVAEDADQIIGFKLGFPRGEGTFHSTLGAVRGDRRGRGVGRALMRAQHEWARDAGFRRITTSTRNHCRAMLHLDLSEGFDITGTEQAPEGGVKITLAKDL